MKKSISELLSLPVDTVEELLERGDLTAYTVGVLHVFEYDELVAQQVIIMVGPQEVPPTSPESVERILKRIIATLEEARVRNRVAETSGFAETRQEGIIH